MGVPLECSKTAFSGLIFIGFPYPAVKLFLDGLHSESLSPGCETQRQTVSRALTSIVKKIQNAHPSIRPRVNTPGYMKKPPPLPPNGSGTMLEHPPPEEGMGEVYEEPVSDLAEEANNGGSQDGEQQEVYEAMENGQDVYEEPGEKVGEEVCG